MKFQNSLLDISQVYDFIRERPLFSLKNERDKFKELLSELNEDTRASINFLSPSTFMGKFGKKQVINIRNAPSFDDKSRVVEWLYKQFSE